MKTTIENLYNAFAIGDIPTVLDGFDDSIIWNEAEGNPYDDGNPYEGPDAVLNGVFARIGGEWENFRLVDILLHEIPNNQVLATLRYHGKYLKTGIPINVQAAHLWTLKEGKVIAFQQYADTKQLAAAMNS
jgi:ketosteroid isomerase-like protein